MNIVNKLTIRHMKENKRRTLVTIIGVIISVAMVTAVATLAISFLDLMKRDAIANSGEWHVKYGNVSAEKVKAIKSDEETKQVILEKDAGYAKLEGLHHKQKPYLFVTKYNEEGFDKFPIELSEGRFPSKKSEVVISEDIIEEGGTSFEIGDQLSLEIGQRYVENNDLTLTQRDSLQTDEEGVIEKLSDTKPATFTIVGMIERPTWIPSWAPGYTVVGYTNTELLDPNEKVDVLVVLNEVSRSLYDDSKELAEQLGIGMEQVTYNDGLLRFYGIFSSDSMNLTMLMVTAVIMAVIIIGSVALIYNAFAISVSERTRHLGMLASVGATKKQKRNSVLFEGVIVGLISIPIGLVAGIAGMAVTFSFINANLAGALNISHKLEVVITPLSMIASCLISMITIFISSYMPAKRASKISPVDAIRQSQDITLTKKAIKASPLVRTIFGMEAEIGLKNMKRNKKRYVITIFSLVVSIVLFLSVSFLTNNLKKAYDVAQEEINHDIRVTGIEQLSKPELQSLTSLTNVTDSTVIIPVDLYTFVDVEAIAEPLKETVEQDKSVLENGKYLYYVVLHVLDPESYKEYVKKASLEGLNGDQPGAIAINQITYQDQETGKFHEIKAMDVSAGDQLSLYTNDEDSMEKEFVSNVDIQAVTDQFPMGVTPVNPGGMNLVTSADMMDEILPESVNTRYTSLYLNSSDPMTTQNKIEDLIAPGMNVYNIHETRVQNEQTVTLLSIFTYGFIILISAISTANIFNTLTTSISLRKREFAMLKSVGMTPKSFDKMVHFESIFYGIKALLYGLPISFVVIGLMHLSFKQTFSFGFLMPWLEILITIVAIFLIVSCTMLYSIRKVKKENIIETLKQENI